MALGETYTDMRLSSSFSVVHLGVTWREVIWYRGHICSYIGEGGYEVGDNTLLDHKMYLRRQGAAT